MTDTKPELIDDVKKKITNIVSHFKFMSPMTTSPEEIAVLDKGVLVIDDHGDNRFGLTFHLPEYLYLEIAPSLQKIEESLMGKSASVFKYFEGSKVLYVKVNQKSSQS